MKAILLSLSVILSMITTSCTENLIKEIESYHSDSIPAIENYYKLEDSLKILVKRIKYFPNGVKEIEGEFDEYGNRNGDWKYWTDKGNLWSEGEFKNGKRDGFGTVWHKDGGKYYEGNSVDGKQNGVWKYWTEEGKLVKKVKFDMGKVISQENIK